MGSSRVGVTQTLQAATAVKILEIGAYPPPRGGWSVRIELLKKHLVAEGHECVVLNIGASRLIPSPEYETVAGGFDYVRKVWRYSRRGYVAHTHANGESPKGLVLALVGEILNLLAGKRCFLTFHAGADQPYFPRRNAPLLIPVYWLLFAIPQRIVCNSEAVKLGIVEYGVRPDKVLPIQGFTRQYLDFNTVPLPPEVDAFYARYSSVILTYLRIQPGYYIEALIEGFARIAARHPDVGLLLVGVEEDAGNAIWERTRERISEHRLWPRVCVLPDVDHDVFLTLLTRSALYLRTPSSDGVASSVLEALALGVPVVASENGARPQGVITFAPDDAVELAARVDETLVRRGEIARNIVRPQLRDTLAEEISLLTAV